MKKNFPCVHYSPPVPTWAHVDSSFNTPAPQVPCMSEGLFTRVLIPFTPLICILCSAKEGTWKSQMAYLFPQETLCNLAGHLPNWKQGEMPLFQEGLVQMPLSLRGQLWVPLGYILFYSTTTLWRVWFHFVLFLPETTFLEILEREWKGGMEKKKPFYLWPFFAQTQVSIILIQLK